VSTLWWTACCVISAKEDVDCKGHGNGHVTQFKVLGPLKYPLVSRLKYKPWDKNFFPQVDVVYVTWPILHFGAPNLLQESWDQRPLVFTACPVMSFHLLQSWAKLFSSCSLVLDQLTMSIHSLHGLFLLFVPSNIPNILHMWPNSRSFL